jgi:hypothetical protein
MHLLVMKFSLPSRPSTLLQSKYSPQHPVLKYPQFVPPLMLETMLHPYRTTGKIMVLYIVTLTFFDSRREARRLWTEW